MKKNALLAISMIVIIISVGSIIMPAKGEEEMNQDFSWVRKLDNSGSIDLSSSKEEWLERYGGDKKYLFDRTRENELNSTKENIASIALHIGGEDNTSWYFDIAEMRAYYSEYMNIFGDYRKTPSWEMTSETLKLLENTLEKYVIGKWNYSYIGSYNIDSTGDYGWDLAIEFVGGNVISYYGYGFDKDGYGDPCRPADFAEVENAFRKAVKEARGF